MDREAVFDQYRGHEADPEAQDVLWQQLVATALADPAVPFERHLLLYRTVFAERRSEDGPPQAWRPDDVTLAHANVTALAKKAGVPDYQALHAWSVADRAAFWDAALDRLGVPFQRRPDRILDDSRGPEHPVWLPGAVMNAAQACFIAPPDRVAIVAGEEGAAEVEHWTYSRLKRLADRVSRGLYDLGLQIGDAVALYMPMTPECVAAYLGIVQAGMAVVSIPDSFAPTEVATRLRLGDAQLVITVDGFRRGGKWVEMASKAREAGAQRLVVIHDQAGEDTGTPDDAVAWETFLGSEEPFEAVGRDPYDVSNILFSSGTTGEPKAIGWTHLTPLKSAVDGHFHQDIHADDVVAWPTNIGWMMGPWLIYASLANQATMALWKGAPSGDAFMSFLRQAKVSVLGVVPAMVRSWQAAGVEPHTLPNIRIFSSTGEASNDSEYLYLMSLAGYRAPVIEYCGGTEIGGGHITGTVARPASPATFSTPALGLDFVILDDDHRPVSAGEMGEIYLVPPSIGLSQSLLNRDHHEEYFARCPSGPGGEVLRRHGDDVHVLAKGFWAAGGRADDTMNLGGIKVSSIELENAMHGHPAVREAAAVAVRPGGGGADHLVVFVVPAKDMDKEVLQGELQARIRERLNPLFRIHDVVFADHLPRTASNKVMRRELRAGYAR